MKVVALFLFMITHGATWASDRGFSLRGTTLEKSNFNQVFKTLGLSKGTVLSDKGTIYADKDKKASSIEEYNPGKFVCFITRDGMVLEFWSSNFRGLAPGKYITEINMYTPGHENIRFDPKKCPRISLNSNRLKFRNRIGLNTKKKRVHRYFGTPMKESGARFFRSSKSVKNGFVVGLPKSRVFKGMEVHTFRESINNKLDETLTIRAGYDKDNRVNMISASKVTTTDRGFSLKGIVLEESDFDHIFNVFKKTKITSQGDAASFLKWICFISKEGDFLKFGVWLGTEINQIHLISSEKREHHPSYDKCSRISLSSKDIKFKNGIGLLTKREDVIKHLGKPLTKKENARFSDKLNKGEVRYRFDRAVLIRDEEYNEALTIETSYDSNNRIDKISVYKGTFN